jgi:VanZ family protein
MAALQLSSVGRGIQHRELSILPGAAQATLMPNHNACNRLMRIFWRVLTFICVLTLALLSLMPAGDLPNTGFSGLLNHFIAYAGSCAIAIAAYRTERPHYWKIIVAFWAYAAVLEYLQHFAPTRHPAIKDFLASAIGAASGGVAGSVLLARLLQLTAVDRRH